MKVPYAKKWQKETDKLRQIALDCDLTEELKWGKPCFTFLEGFDSAARNLRLNRDRVGAMLHVPKILRAGTEAEGAEIL